MLVLSGDDPTALPLIASGGDGSISVIANMYPNHFSSMIRYALEGQMQEAVKLNLDLLDIHPLLYVEGNPAGVKAGLEIMDLCSSEVRIPLVPLSQKYKDFLAIEMSKVPELVPA